MNKPTNNPIKVQFSIGAKLVTIVSILLLVSLGTITVLVSMLVSQDLRVTAEEHNFETNQRLSEEVEFTLSSLSTNSMVLMQIMKEAGEESELAKQAANFFFERNHHVAALMFTVPGEKESFWINDRFLNAQGIDVSHMESFIGMHGETLMQAATGETLLLNAAPDFTVPLLALFFPSQRNEGGAILFSSESMNSFFGSGANQSYLINSDGDILIHAESDLVQIGANFANREFIQSIRENTQKSMQRLYSDEGVRYFGAFTKLNNGAAIVITSIEYDKVFEGLVATTRRNIYLTAAVLSISVLLIWFFSKTISVPLRVLAAAARKIESGSFEVQLRAKGHDEVGVLTQSFYQMSAALGIFGKFTNREIAVRAMQGEIKPGGLPKNATIFFSDIRNFTEKSEIITHEFGDAASDKIVHWLNDYLTHMVECVEKTNGVVDKFIGDSVMAHWGTAHTSGSAESDALECIKSALMMRAVLINMNKDRDEENRENPRITIGCGINTGIVTVGQIGSEQRMDYTVVGDPVNLASRAESLNKPFGTDILITENTWNLVKDFIVAEEMPPVHVKGKEKPVRLFAVVNLASNSDGPRTLADVRKLLNLETPDIAAIDINSLEKKYSIDGIK